MRASSTLACGAALLAAIAAVACAASGNNAHTTLSPDSGGSETPIPDGGGPSPIVDADVEASADRPLCSADGRCATSLPDVDLTMQNIWHLPGHAFAVAVSPTLGAKVLEWNEAERSWKYIDDGTQNEPGMGDYVGTTWAPNANEVYYGVSPGYIYHGTRPGSPQAAWSWTRHRLRDDGDSIDPADGNPTYWVTGATLPALGVWGTSASDVYAWFANSIYHWKSVDGARRSGPVDTSPTMPTIPASASSFWAPRERAPTTSGSRALGPATFRTAPSSCARPPPNTDGSRTVPS